MILHQYVEEKISTNFNILCNFNGRKIDVVSMCFLRRILNRQKIDFSSTCFLWRNFDGQKIDILLTYFIPRNFAGQKWTLFRCTLFDAISMNQKSMLFWLTFFDIMLMAQKVTVISMYFLSNFHEKLIQFRETDFDLFLEDKQLVSFWHLFLKSCWYIKK